MLNKDDDLELPASLKRAAPPPNGNGKKAAAPVETKQPDAPKPDAKPATAAKKTSTKKTSKPAPKPAAAKKAPPKASDREGMVTVVDIAKEYKMIPREARAALRAAKLKKPSIGWAFPPNSPALNEVRAVLKAATSEKK
jgi:hypothetical protein